MALAKCALSSANRSPARRQSAGTWSMFLSTSFKASTFGSSLRTVGSATVWRIHTSDSRQLSVPSPCLISEATRHRPHPRHAGRQDRTEPADERDAGGDGAGALQVVVRGLRPRPRQGRRPRPRTCPSTSPTCSRIPSRTRSSGRFRRGGRCAASMRSPSVLNGPCAAEVPELVLANRCRSSQIAQLRAGQHWRLSRAS